MVADNDFLAGAKKVNIGQDREDTRFKKVLDHGVVRLVDSMGNDLSISRAARVSYNAKPREADARLIQYLWANRHTTPFEAVTFTFEIKAPIFVLRQWHRHRTWSYNEVSARYTTLPSEFYVPDGELIGVQSKDNKQMRDNVPRTDSELLRDAIRQQCQASYLTYCDLLNRGVPRELARTVLPVGMYSHMFATVSLLNLFHFCKLNQHEHSQYELRVYADAMIEIVQGVVPIAVAAFKELP